MDNVTNTRPPTRAEAREMRLREIRERAEAAGNMKEMFPTAGYTVTLPQYPVALTTQPQEAVAEPVQEGRLATLAHEINTRFTLADKLDSQANDHRLAAAIQLAEAKKVCITHKINFKAWASASVPQAYRTVRDLAWVGAAPDPAKALEDLRNKNAINNRELRERRKAIASDANPFAPAGESAEPEQPPAEAEKAYPLDWAVPYTEPVVEAPATPAPQEKTAEAQEAQETEDRPSLMALQDIVDALPLLDGEQRRLVADKAVVGLPAKAARQVIHNMAERLGLKVSRGGSNYFATIETMLTDFATLEPAAQAEFLRLAAASMAPPRDSSE